jgi:hypothetical protein
MIFRIPAQNVNESVDKTRQHNLGNLHTGMDGPLPATTSVGKQLSCAITLWRPIGLVAQGTQVSPVPKTGAVWVTSLPDCNRGPKCGESSAVWLTADCLIYSVIYVILYAHIH